MKKQSGKSEYARSVCPVIKDGKPDMFNGVPYHAVTIEESKSRGWIWFWDSITPCSQGHIAARYLTNPAMCVDCNRIAQGKKPIYPNNTGDELTSEGLTYVEPVANSVFEWSTEKRKQFLTAYVNTCSVPAALHAIGAQMSHLLQIRRDDSAFREEIDRVEATDVRQAQFYRAEAAALENDRMQQLQAQRKFPDSFGSGAQNGLGRAEIGTPEQIDAEFAQLLRGASGPGRAEKQADGPAGGGSKGEPIPAVVADGKGGDSQPVPSGGVPAQDDPNCDLVS